MTAVRKAAFDVSAHAFNSNSSGQRSNCLTISDLIRSFSKTRVAAEAESSMIRLFYRGMTDLKEKPKSEETAGNELPKAMFACIVISA